MRNMLQIFNWFYVVHPSYWDVLSDINFCWDLEPRINAIGWSTCCTSLTMTEWCIPVNGMHSGLWVMYRDQCHWMKHILNISNYVCPVHISNWDALGRINYILMSMSSDKEYIAYLQLISCSASQLLGFTKWYQLFVDMMSLPSMLLDEARCMSLTMTEGWIPVTGVHPRL